MTVRRATALLLALASALGPACATVRNYPDATGPRFAGAYGVPVPPPEQELKVVSFNIKFSRRITRALAVLTEHPDLRGLDVLALQEMAEDGVARVAHALRMNYVYYPSAEHSAVDGNFGNAILARWPLVDDRKILLPHKSRWHGLRRAVVAATMVMGERRIRLYSVHLETPSGITGAQRRDQARAILEDAVPAYDHVIVAGDFNSRWVAEVFEAAGFTWVTKRVGSTLRFFQWDHVFVRGLAPRGPPSAGVVRRIRGASDHFPVWATVAAPISARTPAPAGP